MRKHFATLGIMVAVLIAVLALGSWALAQSDEGQPAADLSGSDELPMDQPEVVIPERYQPDKESVATEDGSDAQVYFVPQDLNTNTTVLFLYNTSSGCNCRHPGIQIDGCAISQRRHSNTTRRVGAHSWRQSSRGCTPELARDHPREFLRV